MISKNCAVCLQKFYVPDGATTADERTLCLECRDAVNKPCEHDYHWSRYCGAQVCNKCGDHEGLARCYCGFGLQPGERLEDDIGEGTFDGESWNMEY